MSSDFELVSNVVLVTVTWISVGVSTWVSEVNSELWSSFNTAAAFSRVESSAGKFRDLKKFY